MEGRIGVQPQIEPGCYTDLLSLVDSVRARAASVVCLISKVEIFRRRTTAVDKVPRWLEPASVS
jgi:hypothetical protein